MASDDCYTQRVVDGAYDDIAAQLMAMETAALANATYKTNFVRAVTDRGNYRYHTPTKGDDDFTACIVGEIVPSFLGTVISAKGNHWPGPNANVGFYLFPPCMLHDIHYSYTACQRLVPNQKHPRAQEAAVKLREIERHL
jgi:hypothetical protein